jgi:thiol-disulfide isomerase/thioredoxin
MRLLLLVAILSGASGAAHAQHALNARKHIVVRDLHGKRHVLAQYVKSETLLHVWGTWCSECLDVYPQYNRLADSLSRDSISVVNVAIEINGFAHWKKVTTRVGTGMQFYYDSEHAADKSGYLGLPWIKSIPAYIAIDPSGVVKGEWYELPTARTVELAIRPK